MKIHPTDKAKGSDRKISVEQLDPNLYKLMKWRSSLSDTGLLSANLEKLTSPGFINISEGHFDQELAPLELPLDFRGLFSCTRDWTFNNHRTYENPYHKLN